jgi:hypothetical protein
MNSRASVEFFVFLLFSLIAIVGLVWVFSGITGRVVEPFCTDTDGLNFTVKGAVFFEGGNKTDTCIDSHLRPQPSGSGLWEYFCKKGKMAYVYYSCPVNCINGACTKRTSIDQVSMLMPQ